MTSSRIPAMIAHARFATKTVASPSTYAWRRQRRTTRTPCEVEEQACRYRVEQRRRRHAGGIEHVGDPVIAHMQQVERADRAVEAARPVEAGTEVLLARCEGGVDLRKQTLEARLAQLEPHEVRMREHLAHRPAEADHVQHRGIAGAEQGAHRAREGQGRDSGHRGVEALLAPAELQRVVAAEPRAHSDERRIALAAGDFGHRSARYDDASMPAIAHHEDFDPRRPIGDRIEVRIAPARRDDAGNGQQYEESEKRRAKPFGGAAHHAMAPSRSSASLILARRPSASSRFSRSPSTTSSGARARKSRLPSLASMRATSDVALAISFSRRPRSAAMSMMPASGRATTSPRTTICTDCGGTAVGNAMSDSLASRLMKSPQVFVRDSISLFSVTTARGIWMPAGTFISARTERTAPITSISHPISASAAGSSRPSCCGHRVSTSRLSRPAPLSPVTRHSSSVMNGMNGCSSLRISSSAQAVVARISVLAALSGPIR